jgi:hypothetical protein
MLLCEVYQDSNEAEWEENLICLTNDIIQPIDIVRETNHKAHYICMWFCLISLVIQLGGWSFYTKGYRTQSRHTFMLITLCTDSSIVH